MTRKEKASPTVDYRETLLEDLRADPQEAVEYLNAALKEGRGAFLVALKDVVDARLGVSGLARETELHRVALHRALSETGNPTLETLERVLAALSMELSVIESRADQPPKRLTQQEDSASPGSP